MIENLPTYISLAFGLTTAATLVFAYWALKRSTLETTRQSAVKVVIGMLAWLLLQAGITLSGFYHTDANALPPKIVLFGILPVLTAIISLFATAKGRKFIDSLPLEQLTYLSVVRVPVEVVLYYLFIHKAVPELMTFEGRNYDILAGLTAPFVAYFGLTTNRLSRTVLLIWNFLCLSLLINIVVNAFLSSPSPLQQFAFEQPNIAILYFPFSWLPTFVAPIVLFTHLVSIRQLIKAN